MNSFEDSILRVLKGDSVVGAAFLVSDRLVATCAHVVESAGVEVGGKITLRLSNGKDIDAIVEPDFWRDPNAEDISILRLNEPLENLQPVILGSSSGTKGHSFSTFGFPKQGQELSGGGNIIGQATINGIKVLQLRSAEVTPGFSGAPIYDEITKRVVGMVVAITPPDEYQRLGTTAFVIPSETTREICPELQISDICPYRSLEVFNEEDAPFFFGRERVVLKMLDSLKREPRFLAVLGPSGSGKSSAVRAGLIPALKQGKVPGSDKWRVLTIRPANQPFEQLDNAGLSKSQDGLENAVRAWLDIHPETTRFVLVVDQFEEALVSTPEDIRQQFIKELTDVIDSPIAVTVMLTLRDDFYSRFLQDTAVMTSWLERGLVNIPTTLEQNELREMVIEPAMAAGLIFEEGLIDDILSDAIGSEHTKGMARSTVLPLLEFALARLWEKRQNGLLSHDSYLKIGGVTGGLTQWADQAYNALENDNRVLARHILTELVYLGNPTESLPDHRRRRALWELYTEADDPGRIENVVHRLADSRLLVTSMEDDNETVEIIHDALVNEWGLLNEWLQDSREFLLWRQRNENRLKSWLTSGDELDKLDTEQLLLGHELAVAEYWMQTQIDSLNPAELLFIRESLSERENQKAKKKRQSYRIRVGLGIFILLILLLLNFSIEQLKVARSNELTYQAQSAVIEKKYNLAGLYAYQANKIYSNQAALAILGKLPYENFPTNRGLLGHTGGVTSVAWSFDGRLASGAGDGTIIIWDLAMGQPAKTLRKSLTISSVAWSPDGQLASSSLNDVNVAVWDSVSGKLALELKGHNVGVTSVAWSSDGRLASGAGDGMIIIWDLEAVKPAQVLQPHTTYINVIAWSSDGRLASASADGTIIVWDLRSGTPAQTLKEHITSVSTLAWSADDRLASGSADGTIIIWDLEAAKPAQTLKRNTSAVTSVAWSPDGRLASASTDRTVVIWDIDKSRPSLVLDDNTAEIFSIAWSPDNRLASASNDQTISLWDFSTYEAAHTLEGHAGSVQSVGWSPTGQLASGHMDGSVTIWDLESEKPVHVLKGHTNSVNSIGWSSDGRLASGSADGTTIIWDLEAEKPAQVLQSHTTYVYGIAWSSDGRLASASADGTIIVWDLRSGTPAQTLKEDTQAASSVAWSPDGRLASGSWDKTVIIWDLISGKPAKVLKGHTNAVSDVAWSSDGRLASSSWDKTIILWDLVSDKPSETLSLTARAFSVAWSKKGYLAAALESGSIGIWDTTDNQSKFLLTLSGHTFPVAEVAWFTDGRLASASLDGTVKIPRAEIMDPEPCKWIGRNLSLSEWISFVGTLFVYEPVCPTLSSPKIDFQNQRYRLGFSLLRPDLVDRSESFNSLLTIMSITRIGRVIILAIIIMVEVLLLNLFKELLTSLWAFMQRAFKSE